MSQIRRNRPTATLAQALAGTDPHRVMPPNRVAEYAAQFGVGAGTVTPISDANSVTKGGTYYLTSSGAGIPVAVAGVLSHYSADIAGIAAQKYSAVGAGVADIRVWYRRLGSGGWSDWHEVWSEANVKTGIGNIRFPDGTIMQRGGHVGGTDPISVTFPYAFKQTVDAIALTVRGSYAAEVSLTTDNETLTGFDVNRNGGTTVEPFYWTAVGK